MPCVYEIGFLRWLLIATARVKSTVVDKSYQFTEKKICLLGYFWRHGFDYFKPLLLKLDTSNHLKAVKMLSSDRNKTFKLGKTKLLIIIFFFFFFFFFFFHLFL